MPNRFLEKCSAKLHRSPRPPKTDKYSTQPINLRSIYRMKNNNYSNFKKQNRNVKDGFGRRLFCSRYKLSTVQIQPRQHVELLAWYDQDLTNGN